MAESFELDSVQQAYKAGRTDQTLETIIASINRLETAVNDRLGGMNTKINDREKQTKLELTALSKKVDKNKQEVDGLKANMLKWSAIIASALGAGASQVSDWLM